MLQMLQAGFQGSGALTLFAGLPSKRDLQHLQQLAYARLPADPVLALDVASVACVRVITEIAFLTPFPHFYPYIFCPPRAQATFATSRFSHPVQGIQGSGDILPHTLAAWSDSFPSLGVSPARRAPDALSYGLWSWRLFILCRDQVKVLWGHGDIPMRFILKGRSVCELLQPLKACHGGTVITAGVGPHRALQLIQGERGGVPDTNGGKLGIGHRSHLLLSSSANIGRLMKRRDGPVRAYPTKTLTLTFHAPDGWEVAEVQDMDD